MGRKRKQNPLGLPERVYAVHGAFFYVHRDGRWERLGTDLAEARRRGNLQNDPEGRYGTVGYYLDQFIIHCAKRVAAHDLSKRTLADYTADIVPLKVYFGDMTPAGVGPANIGKYLDLGVEHGRPVRANREKACLSSCFTWLIRTGEGGITQNPCIGVKRNSEHARERYIEDWEFNQVMAKATSPQAKAVAGLIYRTLQRPIDILRWTAANIARKPVEGGEERVLRFRQSKTGAQLEIRITPEIDECLRWAAGDGKKVTGMTLIHTGKGQPYADKSISGMWGTYVRDCPGIEDFAIYDLKGKGATDMWLAGVPLEQIQALCGHESITTTEIYVKCRWRDTIEPNRRVVGK